MTNTKRRTISGTKVRRFRGVFVSVIWDSFLRQKEARWHSSDCFRTCDKIDKSPAFVWHSSFVIRHSSFVIRSSAPGPHRHEVIPLGGVSANHRLEGGENPL